MNAEKTCSFEASDPGTAILKSGLVELTLPHRGERRHQARLIDRVVRQRLVKQLARFEGGEIDFLDGEHCEVVGTNSLSAHRIGHRENLRASLLIRDRRFYRQLLTGGSLGFAEAYLRGWWTTNKLTDLLRIFTRNLDLIRNNDRGLARVGVALATGLHRLARNTRAGSRRNIASHYDLSNNFFATFLDPTMMYSSAIFEDPEMSLEEASINKLETICRQLDLQPKDRVIEVGTGWGGWAIHAAKNYGCHVTTTTVSRQQYAYARRRIAEEGLQDRITLLCEDYRDLTGQYDKLVSIEMLEAVGAEYFDTYFQKCNSLLKRGGRMLVQTITIPEQRYDSYLRSADFIQRYIFPGGCLPSLAAIQQSVGRMTDLRLLDYRDFGMSYAKTLEHWNDRFHDRLEDIRELGFDDRFIRMWEYYFSYCEAAFLERAVGVSQLLWTRT